MFPELRVKLSLRKMPSEFFSFGPKIVTWSRELNDNGPHRGDSGKQISHCKTPQQKHTEWGMDRNPP